MDTAATLDNLLRLVSFEALRASVWVVTVLIFVGGGQLIGRLLRR